MGREAAPSVARARLAAPTTSLMPMLQGASAARFFGREGKPEQLPPPIDGMVRRAKRPSASGPPAKPPGQVVQRA